MSSIKCLFPILLLLLCSFAVGETTEAEVHLQSELTAAKAQISKLTAEKDAALSQLQAAESAKVHALEAADLSKKASDGLSLKIQQLETDLAQATHKTQELEAQLAQARRAAASSQEMQELLKQAQEAWLPLWMQYRLFQAQQTIVQLLEDLKGGKHGPIGVRVHGFLDVANEHATKAFFIVKPHMDKGYAAASLHAGKAYAAAKPHVEDGLSKASVALEKALVNFEAFRKKYITDAEWMHEVKTTTARVEAELVREVSKIMNDVPALKAYSDPVTVQLLVYAILLLAVLIILVPVLALTCSRPAPSKESHKRKQEKSGKPSSHGHGHAKRSKRV